MELFRYIDKDGKTSVVHTQYHPGRIDAEWSLRINGNPYSYCRREQDVRGAGTKLRNKLIKDGCTIITSGAKEKWSNDYGMKWGVSKGGW